MQDITPKYPIIPFRDKVFLPEDSGFGSTIGNGLLQSTVSDSIDKKGNYIADVINTKIDTSAKNILGAFTFGASGALQIGTYVNGVTGDIRISPAGIIARNTAGVNTITIDGTTGALTLVGTITASAGSIGGWTINTTSLSGGTGANYIGLVPETGIQLGSSTFADALFSVTKAGVLKAISGTVGGCVLASTSIGSTSFLSGSFGYGWNISNTGVAEFQNVMIRGSIRTSVFEKDTISAVNGIVLVSSADILDADMTAADNSTITITGQTTFSVNEVIRINDGMYEEWMLVTGVL